MPPGAFSRVSLRALLLAGFWWVLTGGEAESWIIAVPAIFASIWVMEELAPCPAPRPKPWRLLVFVPWFLKESLVAGVDVARRAFAPRPRLAPGVLSYRPWLPDGAPRLFFANCISLLPGTLTADWRGGELRIHVLDEGLDNRGNLKRLEARVGRAFGMDEHTT